MCISFSVNYIAFISKFLLHWSFSSLICKNCKNLPWATNTVQNLSRTKQNPLWSIGPQLSPQRILTDKAPWKIQSRSQSMCTHAHTQPQRRERELNKVKIDLHDPQVWDLPDKPQHPQQHKAFAKHVKDASVRCGLCSRKNGAFGTKTQCWKVINSRRGLGNRQGEDTGMVGCCSASACHPGSFLQLLTCSQVQPGAAHLLLLGQSAPSLLPGWARLECGHLVSGIVLPCSPPSSFYPHHPWAQHPPALPPSVSLARQVRGQESWRGRTRSGAASTGSFCFDERREKDIQSARETLAVYTHELPTSTV